LDPMLGLCFDRVFIKLATLTDKPLYKQIAEDHLDYWQNRIKSTPGGLKYLDSWVFANILPQRVWFSWCTISIPGQEMP